MKNIHSRADAMREMKPKGDTRPNLKGTKKSGKKDDVSMVAKTETGTEIKIRRNQVFLANPFMCNYLKYNFLVFITIDDNMCF